MDKFVVVKFYIDNTVALISKKWILTEVVDSDGRLICYWPPNNFTKRCKKEEIPDVELWSKYEIKVLASTDDFSQGMVFAKAAEDTSNFETACEEEKQRKRKPVQYSCSDSEGSAFRAKSTKNKRLSTVAAGKLTMPKAPLFNPASLPINSQRERVVQGPTSELSETQSCSRDSHCPNNEPIMTPAAHCHTSNDTSNNCQESNGDCASNNSQEINGDGAINNQQESHGGNDGQISTPRHGQDTTPVNPNVSLTDVTYLRLEENTDTRRHIVTNFHVSVLAKLDTIMENQREQLLLLRNIVAQSSDSGECVEDVMPGKINSFEDLLEFDEKLRDAAFRKKMVNLLSITGGKKLTEAVRKIMAKLATNGVWSSMSYRGRKGKKAFVELRTCRLILRAAARTFRKAKENEIEEAIAEVLRNAPHRPGGSKYMPKEQPRRPAHDSESDGTDNSE